MSYEASRLAMPLIRHRMLLSFFLTLWLLCALGIGTHIISLKVRIKGQRLQSVTSALNKYLAQGSPTGRFHFGLHSDPPEDIDFIRLSKGKDQLLITGNKAMTFTGLIDLAPSAQGTWIDLNRPTKAGMWLLVSIPLKDGTVAQAGKDDSTIGITIYQKARSDATRIFLLMALPCIGLAFLLRNLLRRPLNILAADINEALTRQGPFLRSQPPQDQDLKPLYHLLGKTFTQNRQLIGEMQSSLDNVAHDLRTPMTRLRAVAEYALQSNKESPEIYRSALSDCLEESERVLSMLKIMMSVAEAEAGTMRLAPQEIDLMATLHDVIGLYQYVAEEKQITVSCPSPPGPLITIVADPTRISQVWANLLDNAIKYGHESGRVEIKATLEEGQAMIRFHDDGMGISKKEMGRIWDRLYRGDRSRSTQGLGLGLNYVQAVVTAHGGQVSVSSTIKEGSCFEISLPIGD